MDHFINILFPQLYFGLHFAQLHDHRKGFSSLLVQPKKDIPNMDIDNWNAIHIPSAKRTIVIITFLTRTPFFIALLFASNK